MNNTTKHKKIINVEYLNSLLKPYAEIARFSCTLNLDYIDAYLVLKMLEQGCIDMIREDNNDELVNKLIETGKMITSSIDKQNRKDDYLKA